MGRSDQSSASSLRAQQFRLFLQCSRRFLAFCGMAQDEMAALRDSSTPVRELAEKAQASDTAAFAEISRLHMRRLDALSGSLMTPKLRRQLPVEDVVQETLARALESIGRCAWQGEGSLLRWLVTIARHVIARSASRESSAASSAPTPTPMAVSTSPTLSSRSAISFLAGRPRQRRFLAGDAQRAGNSKPFTGTGPAGRTRP